MIGKSQPTLQFSDSVSEAGTTVHSDGEQSVGTMEIESPNTTEGAGSGEPAWAPHGGINDDTESILELLKDRYGYGIEEEEFESEPGLIRRAAVYTTSGGVGFDDQRATSYSATGYPSSYPGATAGESRWRTCIS